MNELKEFYTLAEVTDLLGLSESDVLRYVDRGDLPICFDFDGALLQAAITYEDGTTEHADLPVPIRGVLKSLDSPRDHESLTALCVRVLYLNEGGVTYEYSGGELLEWKGGILIEEDGEPFIKFSDGNRFRKLLVRYEKLERSFVALNHLAAAIIAFRKVPLAINIIYG